MEESGGRHGEEGNGEGEGERFPMTAVVGGGVGHDGVHRLGLMGGNGSVGSPKC